MGNLSPYSDDRSVQSLQSAVSSIEHLLNHPLFASGRRFDLTIAGGDRRTLSHRLRRRASVCIVLLCQGGPALIESVPGKDRSTIDVINHHSGEVDVSVWIA